MESYNGHVRTPADASILFEACHIGLLPRVQRRLSKKERQSIKSGSVFVWEESEAGMRRWTDGRSWSASRVSGSFLTYREMEGKRGGSTFETSAPCESMQTGAEKESDGGPDGFRYKPDGLVKQSFSVTTDDGRHMHLISYYSLSSQAEQHLVQPTNDPQLRHVRTEKGMYSEPTIPRQRTVPAVIRGPMGSPGYIHAAHQPSMYGRSPCDYAPPYLSAWAPPGSMHTLPPHPHYGLYSHHPACGHPVQHPHQSVNGPNSYDRAQRHLICSSLPPPPHYDRGPPPPPPSFGGLLPGYPPRQNRRGSHQPPPISTPSFASASAAAPPVSLATRPAPPPIRNPERKEDDRHDSTQTQLKSRAQPTPETSSHSTVASTPPTTNSTTSSARAEQTIPSISLMLNAENGPPTVRSSSRSPSGSGRMASDIPMHKLGFKANRDMQALRNLDKSIFKPY